MSTELTDERRAQAFEAWFLANYPRDVIIVRPEWHAPKIYRAATHEAEQRIAELERERDLLAETARRLAGDADRLRYIAENPETMRLLYDMLGEMWVNNETGDVRTGLLKAGHAPLDGIRQLIDECKAMDAARATAGREGQ